MNKHIVCISILLLLSTLWSKAQHLEITQSFKYIPNSSVLASYKNQFGSWEKDDYFPYTVIRVGRDQKNQLPIAVLFEVEVGHTMPTTAACLSEMVKLLRRRNWMSDSVLRCKKDVYFFSSPAKYLSYEAISISPCPERLNRITRSTPSSLARRASSMVALMACVDSGAGIMPSA